MKKLFLILFIFVSPCFAEDKVNDFGSWWDAQFTHDDGGTVIHMALSGTCGIVSHMIGDALHEDHNYSPFLSAVWGAAPLWVAKEIPDAIQYGDSFVHTALDMALLDYVPALAGAWLMEGINCTFNLRYARVTCRF